MNQTLGNLSVFRHLLLLIFLTLVFVVPALAQIETQSPPQLRRDAKGAPIPVIVVTDNAKIRQAPKRTAREAGRADFLQVHFLVDTAKEAGKTYCLATDEDESFEAPSRIVGWFHEDDVLTTREALKHRPGIFLKGLVINQWRQATDSGVRIQGATVRKGPGVKTGGDPFPDAGEIGLFSFYFIYKKFEDNRGNAFYLLGETPIMRNVTQPKDTLVGWVASDRVVEWSTRQAVQFDKGTLTQRLAAGGSEGAKIFVTDVEVLAYLQGEESMAGEPLEPVAVEDPKVTSWQHNWPRFPLFEIRDNRHLPSAGPLYNVGFIGDQIYMSGRAGASGAELADNLEKMEVLRREIKNIDLLFVIDSTGSMRNYFPAAAEAVLAIASQVRTEFSGEQTPEIRYSVVFYRDYVDEDGEPEPTDTYLTKRLPFTGNQSAVARFLKDEQDMMCNGCGGDELEAVFYGIDYGITAAAREVKDIGLRAIVLIGDKGNHRRDSRSYTVDKVAKAMRENKYDFFCFHVVNDAMAQGDPEARAFRDQCTDIERKIQMSSTTGRTTASDPKAISQAIIGAARTMGQEMEKTGEAAAKVSRGEAGLAEIRQQYGVRLTQRLSDMMLKKGVDPAIFVEKSVQVFDRGWVTEQDPFSGARQIETVLLVDRPTLEQLQGVLAGMTKEPPTRRTVEALWTKVLKDMTQGDLDVDKTVAELLQGHLGIPIRKKLLKKTLREIGELAPTELAKLYSELLFDLHRIRGIQAEKKLQIEKKPDGTFEAKEVGTRPVWWQGKGGREYAWIPLDELP